VLNSREREEKLGGYSETDRNNKALETDAQVCEKTAHTHTHTHTHTSPVTTDPALTKAKKIWTDGDKEKNRISQSNEKKDGTDR
jgi:hypothetical protein